MFNELMKYVKVVREFSRRIREFDFAVLKAQEMRNIILFLFPIVVQCVEPEAKERRVWFLLAFMIRACVIPEEEYSNVNKLEITHASSQFYSLYQKLFSSRNCTYSVHIVGTHLPQIRSKGPLTETSAFPFENFYGELRNSFTPGTVSPLKQILQKVYLKRMLSYHCCEKTIHYSENDTPLERNSLIYVYENDSYNIYQIFKTCKESPDTLHCYIQGKIEVEFNEAQDVEWSKVGVFKEGATGSEEVLIDRKNVSGKVLKVSSLLITCPRNVLNEI